MSYLKYDQFASRCQSHPVVEEVFAKILRHFGALAEGNQVMVVSPKTSDPTNLFLREFIGHASYWRAGALVIANSDCSGLVASLKSVRKLKRNSQLTILTPYLLVQARPSQDSDSIDVTHGLLSEIHAIERSTRQITKKSLCVDWGDDEPMLIRNVPQSIKQQLHIYIRFLKAINNHYRG